MTIELVHVEQPRLPVQRCTSQDHFKEALLLGQCSRCKRTSLWNYDY